ncbi:hypothetical protein [Duncaniella dubosii]|uniref:hypothetical protein n=1 Tax=Duncaniella dubosii TaxID=2518971 RepID=UPI003F6704E5
MKLQKERSLSTRVCQGETMSMTSPEPMPVLTSRARNAEATEQPDGTWLLTRCQALLLQRRQ